MFEQATRARIRFETDRGLLSVEDLWQLPLQGRGTNLDDIAVGLDRQLKDSSTTSFVDDMPKTNATLQLKFDVVKRIIDVKKEEAQAATVAAERRATKARILEIIAKKQDATLENASIEELEAKLASL